MAEENNEQSKSRRKEGKEFLTGEGDDRSAESLYVYFSTDVNNELRKGGMERG